MDRKRIKRHKIKNMVQGALLLSGMSALLGLLGWLIAGWEGVIWAFAAGAVILAFSPGLSFRTIMRMHGARQLSREEAPDLYRILETLAGRAGLETMPALYYIPSPIRNAFALGDERASAIGLTDGILRDLSLRELAGVMAHELSHIRSNDMWVMNLADVVGRVTSAFSFLGYLLLLLNLPLILLAGARLAWGPILVLIMAPSISSLLMLAFSRTREFEADMEAAELSGDPLRLAGALRKLEARNHRVWDRIFFPVRRQHPQPPVLRTHPDTEERIERLVSLLNHHHGSRPAHVSTRHNHSSMPLKSQSVRRPERWMDQNLRP